MKRRALLDHVRKNGCVPVREGARHSLWRNAETGERSAIPRHTEIKNSTARAICKQLGIPPP